MKKEIAKKRLVETWTVLKTELNFIFHDAGVILILMGAIVIYSTFYALAYKNEVLTEVPVAVVDRSGTPLSRQFVREVDATSQIRVAYRPASLLEAEDLFLKREVYGILYLDRDFEKNILAGDQSFIGIYADGSYFLMFKQVFAGITSVLTDLSGKIGVQRLMSLGLSQEQAIATAAPVAPVSRSLFNPYTGYASFVMPAILVAILQQTLLIGIGMIGGTWRERKLYKKLIPEKQEHMSALPIIFGKSAAYFAISVMTCLYVFGFHYKLFGYPENGAAGTIVAFLIPYILSVIFLGLTFASLFRRRENSIIFLMFTSIPFVMLSGISVPVEARPETIFKIGKIIPMSPGINGFVRIQSMGASLSEVWPEFVNLWILTGVYFLTACLGMRRLAHTELSD